MFLMQEILKWLGIEFAWVLWVPWDKASVGALPFIEDSVPNRQHPGKIQVEHSCLILYPQKAMMRLEANPDPGFPEQPAGRWGATGWRVATFLCLLGIAWCTLAACRIMFSMRVTRHTHTHIIYTICICICYLNKPFTLPVWVIILESNRWNWWVFVPSSLQLSQGFGRLGRWNHLAEFYGWGAKDVGWDGLVVWCLVTCHQKMYKQHNQKMDMWKGTDEATGFNGKKTNEFGKGCIHRTPWNDSGVWNYSTGVQFGSQPPASTKFGSFGHPVETWKPPLQDLRNASLEDLSSHFPSMISIWVLSHPNVVNAPSSWVFLPEKSISSLVSEGKVFIHP